MSLSAIHPERGAVPWPAEFAERYVRGLLGGRPAEHASVCPSRPPPRRRPSWTAAAG